MHRVVSVGLLLAAVSIVATPLSARPRPVRPSVPAGEAADAGELDIEALTQRAATVVDLVLERHVEPPTRQEMWLSATRALLAEADGLKPPAGLSATISGLTTADQFRALVSDLWSQRPTAVAWRTAGRLEEAFIEGLLKPVPGESGLIPLSELNVQEQMAGNRYVGTGIALASREGYPLIAKVIPGGPIERAGGKDQDAILKIDDLSMLNQGVQEIVALLRGEEGTVVRLLVRSQGESGDGHELVVTRGHVVFATLGGVEGERSSHRLNDSSPIRYVQVLQINGSTAHDLKQLERKFREDGARAVILDFRGTFSHDVHHAVLLADVLMDGGLIGRLRTNSGLEEYRADRDCIFREWPLAVLVDRTTRGAGEWIAAALQDSDSAVIIGESTAGDALVETAVALPDGRNALQLATGIFERPSGKPLLRKGHDQDFDLYDLWRDKVPWGVRPGRFVPRRARGAQAPGAEASAEAPNDPTREEAASALQSMLNAGKRRIDR